MKEVTSVLEFANAAAIERIVKENAVRRALLRAAEQHTARKTI